MTPAVLVSKVWFFNGNYIWLVSALGVVVVGPENMSNDYELS